MIPTFGEAHCRCRQHVKAIADRGPECNGNPSRLPFRKKVCLECGGTGQVTPTRREQLRKKNPKWELQVSPRIPGF